MQVQIAWEKPHFAALPHPCGLSIAASRHYLTGMSGFFFTAMIVAMILTVAVLATGMVSMIKGGEFNAKYGNKLMQARVWMQGIALALFALAILTSGK